MVATASARPITAVPSVAAAPVSDPVASGVSADELVDWKAGCRRPRPPPVTHTRASRCSKPNVAEKCEREVAPKLNDSDARNYHTSCDTSQLLVQNIGESASARETMLN